MALKAAPPGVADEEKDLVDRARGGDVAAFEILVSQHQTKLYNLALSMTRDSDEAADVTQEALIKAYRSIDRFRGEASFSSWLFRIARNCFLDQRRRAGREGLMEDIDEAAESRHDTDPAPDGAEEFERSELSAALDAALKNIPEVFRTVVVLYDMQGFSYEEIADITKSSVGTVKSRLNRARSKLKDEILAMGEHFGDYLRHLK